MLFENRWWLLKDEDWLMHEKWSLFIQGVWLQESSALLLALMQWLQHIKKQLAKIQKQRHE